MPYVDLLPAGRVHAATVGGRPFAVHPGWNHLVLGARSVDGLRVAITSVSPPGPGGISELRIPGVHATEQLRLPVDAARALRGADLGSVTLTYLFERTTGDHPSPARPGALTASRSCAGCSSCRPPAGSRRPRG